MTRLGEHRDRALAEVGKSEGRRSTTGVGAQRPPVSCNDGSCDGAQFQRVPLPATRPPRTLSADSIDFAQIPFSSAIPPRGQTPMRVRGDRPWGGHDLGARKGARRLRADECRQRKRRGLEARAVVAAPERQPVKANRERPIRKRMTDMPCRPSLGNRHRRATTIDLPATIPSCINYLSLKLIQRRAVALAIVAAKAASRPPTAETPAPPTGAGPGTRATR